MCRYLWCAEIPSVSLDRVHSTVAASDWGSPTLAGRAGVPRGLWVCLPFAASWWAAAVTCSLDFSHSVLKRNFKIYLYTNLLCVWLVCPARCALHAVSCTLWSEDPRRGRSLLPLRVFQGLSLRGHIWRHASVPAEPSHWSDFSHFDLHFPEGWAHSHMFPGCSHFKNCPLSLLVHSLVEWFILFF